MKNYYESMPDELFDSAVVDGTSTMGAFTRIFLPLSIPGLAVVVVLNFTTVWNDLLVSLLFIPNPNDRTIGVGLATLAGVHNSNNNVLLTASLISTLPTVLVYVFFQRFLVSGILSGMTK
jgi:ABC-type glycerol-3-phosphate transport system permease component